MGSIAPTTRRLLYLSWALLGPSMTGVGLAEDATPFPHFNGDHLYVSGVPDRYDPVQRTIRDLEARAPQKYYVAVVKSAGEGDRATRTYAERLRDEWREQAAAQGLPLDFERSLIVVAALDNRQVVTLPGPTLVDRFGLRGETIDARIVQPKFVPLARQGDYPGALAALLTGVDEFVAARATAASPTAIPPAVVPLRKEVATTTAPAAPVPASAPAGRDAAWAVVGSIVAIGLIVAGLVWLGRRRARGAFRAKFKNYKEKAVAMMDRLDGLKARIKSLPVEDPDFTEPMTGDTLALYEKVQEDLRRLWDRWLEVMDVVDQAEKHAARGSSALAKADGLVSDGKVFEEVERGAQECAGVMDRLNAAHEEARAAVQAVAEAQVRTEEGVATVRAAGLPTAPYQPEIQRIAEQSARAGVILVPDPLGARSILDQAREAAEALVGRAADVKARLEDGKQVQAGIAGLRDEVAEHRRKGLGLAEEGGDPDPSTAQAEQALARMQAALEAGDPTLAATELTAARGLFDQARGVLDAVLKARAACERGLPETRRETQRLREAVSQYAAFEQELRRDFAPGSWQGVAGHLPQARTLLETFDRKADEVEQAADPKVQNYLLGARLLARLNQEQKAVFQLMNGVGEQLAGLKAVREEAKNLAQEIEARDREVGRFFAQYDHVVGSQARESLAHASRAREEAIRATSTHQPDWPSARQALAEAREEYGIARSQAQSDLDVYQVLTNEYDEARNHASRVEAFLAGHGEDRPAANQHFRRAEEILNLVGSDSTRVGNEWPRLLDQVRGARRDLDYSERLAQEDLRLARRAESEIAEAARTLREGRTYLSMGVALDTSPAEALLTRAQGLYHSQNYEQAIEAAGASLQQVRQAHQTAVQQAYARQMQVEAEQRRRAVALQSFGMGAAGGAAGAFVANAASAGEPPRPLAAGREAGGDAPQSEASSSSWSTEASESSW
ncbi:hypothetical protein [Planctomyces sp. SH-PL62]|uniref:hypothetical protein n=1 Tax=Planctomyces sp. SH-PL62 TaxID=1636152 RepID=UPI00078E066C|nr:hypothetical protein [Planctomyces sp. SH-PL62]AMV36917.1 septation ring formation regulator EzrA [Planctomyces sp. SH-PL62]